MKNFALSIFTALSIVLNAQVTDTVSTGPAYTNQVWYSLENDEAGTSPKDNWDLAFEISGFNSSILVNTQKTGTAVYVSPYEWSTWSQFDTTGYKTWTSLHNSDTMWDIGALNKPGTYNTTDLGWGTYDMTSHAIVGSRLYLLVLPGNKYYRLGIKNLIGGVYNVVYTSLDMSDSTTLAVKKSEYNSKNFVYYSLESKTLLDREPEKNDWDITFTKYIYNNYPTGNGFIPYGVTGVLQNKGVEVAEVRNVDVAATNDHSGRGYNGRINEIGSDWKFFNGTAFVLEDSLVYFVQDVYDNYWKLVFTGFGGSANGNYIFSKQKLTNVGIIDARSDKGTIYLFPNPVNTGQNLHLFIENADNSPLQVTIYTLDGREVYSGNSESFSGNCLLPVQNFESGIYFVRAGINGKTFTAKFIVN